MDRIVDGYEIAAMPPVARVGDRTSCPLAGHVGGVIVEGSPTVFANGRAVARVGDKIACGCGTTDTIVSGAAMVRAPTTGRWRAWAAARHTAAPW